MANTKSQCIKPQNVYDTTEVSGSLVKHPTNNKIMETGPRFIMQVMEKGPRFIM